MESTAQLNAAFIRNESGRKTEAAALPDETTEVSGAGGMDLLEAEVGKTYVIKKIDTADEEMNAFLFRLGCYSGEQITIVSKKKKSCVVVIKDGRYNLDEMLSRAIIV